MPYSEIAIELFEGVSAVSFNLYNLTSTMKLQNFLKLVSRSNLYRLTIIWSKLAQII